MFISFIEVVYFKGALCYDVHSLQITGHQPVFINELKLSDFKQVLTKHQIPTDVLGGVLYCCNGTVAVRRVSETTFEWCSDFFKIIVTIVAVPKFFVFLRVAFSLNDDFLKLLFRAFIEPRATLVGQQTILFLLSKKYIVLQIRISK